MAHFPLLCVQYWYTYSVGIPNKYMDHTIDFEMGIANKYMDHTIDYEMGILIKYMGTSYI